jgi:hypothetical protein
MSEELREVKEKAERQKAGQHTENRQHQKRDNFGYNYLHTRHRQRNEMLCKE